MTGGGVVYGGSVLAATVAGAIALAAPCCISVMLPAYLASSFHNRRLLVAMTVLFGAGVATVVLPIALGAAVLQRLLIGQHTLIWTAGGVLLLGLGSYTLAGGRLGLPMPSRTPTPGRAGPLAVYSLGVFSGVASACCAPVLAGVVALSGLAASFTRALGLGGAYVFGMVAPLFLIAVLWDRRDWQASRLLRPRSLTYRIGRLQRTVSASGLASGALLLAMGAATLWIAQTGSPMAPPGGWQARLSAWLDHTGAILVRALGWLPGWAAVLLLACCAGLLGWRAVRQVGWLRPDHPTTPDFNGEEEPDEQQHPQTAPPTTAIGGPQT